MVLEDLYVEIHVHPEKNLHREGKNLFADLEVTYLQAILGTQLEFQLFDESIEVEISKGSQFGDEIRLKGKGLPGLRSPQQGDLFLRLNVKTPKKISKKEAELLAQLAEISGDRVKKPKKGLFLDNFST